MKTKKMTHGGKRTPQPGRPVQIKGGKVYADYLDDETITILARIDKVRSKAIRIAVKAYYGK